MPVIKSAIKKLRKDRKRTRINRARKGQLKKLIKEAVRSRTSAKIVAAISFIDKIAKVHLLHKNKAARLKSRLAKLVKEKGAKTALGPQKKRITRKKVKSGRTKVSPKKPRKKP